ncbi:hypothetical protein [Methylococcus geothermalis]|uniref:Uncharacterized protein n=1 Tax=Methylococcus geothermalis TaxID=2681310 RepID=A0A858Q5F5_9GAMM|nr:hypothetical protein [Methylococcus geothermalis]QJD29034.1 hypothetical protein GNH96_02975 [Methylococcus geothermalis]
MALTAITLIPEEQISFYINFNSLSRAYSRMNTNSNTNTAKNIKFRRDFYSHMTEKEENKILDMKEPPLAHDKAKIKEQWFYFNCLNNPMLQLEFRPYAKTDNSDNGEGPEYRHGRVVFSIKKLSIDLHKKTENEIKELLKGINIPNTQIHFKTPKSKTPSTEATLMFWVETPALDADTELDKQKEQLEIVASTLRKVHDWYRKNQDRLSEIVSRAKELETSEPPPSFRLPTTEQVRMAIEHAPEHNVVSVCETLEKLYPSTDWDEGWQRIVREKIMPSLVKKLDAEPN